MNVLLAVIVIFVLLFGLTAFRGAPYVPSRRRDIKKAFKELYALDDADVLVDVGSGDGIVLREAAKRGAAAIGYEINPVLVMISKWFSRRSPNITIKLADFWLANLPDKTTVVYAFGESRDIEKIARKVQTESVRLGRPLYFISYGFSLKDESALEKQVGAHFLYRFS
jgi:hypothetical protein